MEDKDISNNKPGLTRRRLLKILAGSFVGASLSGGLYSYCVEPYWLKIERHKLSFDKKFNPPSGLTIAHLTDMHRSGIVPDSYLQECVRKTNALKPDLVLLTGDYITWDKKWAVSLKEILGTLQGRLGVFASLGNHDGGDWAGFSSDAVRESLEDAGIHVLMNESIKLSFDDVPVTVVGLGDLWAGDFDAETAFDNVDSDCFAIALSHNPDTVSKICNYSSNLVLCGHTHGGQVRLPLIGALDIVPYHKIRYDLGLFDIRGTKLYVNRGIGTAMLPIRMLCPPEITLFKFVES